MLQARAGSSHPASVGRISEGVPWENGGVLEKRKAFYPRSKQREIRTEESFKNTQSPLRRVRGVRGLLADGSPSPARARQGSQKKDVSCTAAGLRQSSARECAGMSTISTA